MTLQEQPLLEATPQPEQQHEAQPPLQLPQPTGDLTDVVRMLLEDRQHRETQMIAVQERQMRLRRYDINAESYHTRFRGAKHKDGESYRELAVCLQDLLKKWMEGCVTVDEVFEKILIEHAASQYDAS